MDTLNALAGRAIELLLLPFRQLPPVAGLGAVSLATAVAVLLVYRKASDQRRLAAEKQQIQAAIYEIRLFNDDLRAIFRAQGEILRRNLVYLRLSLVPMLWMAVPLVLAIAQLQFQYGYGGLEPGRAVLLKAQLRERPGGGAPPEAALEAPEGIAVETRPVWFPATGELVWRIAPVAAGDYDLQVRVGDERFAKSLHVSDAVARRSPVRLERGFLNQLLYPAEPSLPPGASVTAIRVAFPERGIGILGWEVHWMIVYVALSMAFALALRRRFGVTL